MEGPWVKVLQPVELTGSGLPRFEQGEVECQLFEKTDLVDESTGWALKGGNVSLTTHRILWLDEKAKVAWAVPLGAAGQVYASKKGLKSMFAAPSMRFQVWTQKDGRVSRQGKVGAQGSFVLTIVFKGKSWAESFLNRFGEVLQAKAWTANTEAPQSRITPDRFPSGREAGTSADSAAAAAPRRPAPTKMNPAMAGVSGILRKEQEQQEEVDKNMKVAFQDLNGLMSKAKEMVMLAERMRVRLLQGQAEEEGMGTKQEMQDWMLSVGITSPVTKESAGALYHQQLSRQLADFVKDPVQRAGGMLALVDAYCLFNRARGTELISPEDLLTACTVWASIDVPVRLRKFDSGVMVIQSVTQSDDEVFLRLTTLVKNGDAAKLGVSATEAARSLGMAPALAKEQLLAAESQGLLCRDDGADGLRFFHNFFRDIIVSEVFQSSQVD